MESKSTLVGVRVTEDEKMILEEMSKSCGMSLSQYLRFRLFENIESAENNTKSTDNISSLFIFDEMKAEKLGRMIVDGYFNVRALSAKLLTEKERKVAEEITYEQIDELGIPKKEKE